MMRGVILSFFGEYLKIWIWAYQDIAQTLIFHWIDFLKDILVVGYAEINHILKSLTKILNPFIWIFVFKLNLFMTLG